MRCNEDSDTAQVADLVVINNENIDSLKKILIQALSPIR